MREIKLRGLDRNDGLVKEIERIDFKNEIALFVGEYGWVEFNNVELEQFTGLYDKNGVEIYENDKVFDGKYYGIIEYRECSFVINWEIDCSHDDDLNYWNDKIEVIGNIHEVEEDET